MRRARAFLRLIRASLAPSAVADIVAGHCAGAATGGAVSLDSLLLCAGGSLALYHGGMALNDYADRGVDARLRPDRPIPAGGVPARVALATGLASLVAGVLLAVAAGPRPAVLAALLVGLVLAYDFAARRGGALGPWLLVACRAANLLLGVASAHPPRLEPPVLAAAGAYAAYIALVSFLARMEDAEVRPRAARALAFAAPIVLLAPSLGAPSPAAGAGFAVVGGALLLAPIATRPLRTRADARAAVGRLLGGTILFDASVAAGFGFAVAGVALFAAYPLARALSRLFPPT